MVRYVFKLASFVAGFGLFLGIGSQLSAPAFAQGQDAFQKFVANTARYYVAGFTTKKPNEDVLALLDKSEIQKLDQTGDLQALLQGERGGVLIVLSAFTSDQARGMAGPLLGKNAKTVSMSIRPAIITKSFTDPKGRKPVLKAAMEPYEAAYSVRGTAWVSEGNATSRKVIPEHIALISSLVDKGVIKMYLSFEDSANPRGFIIFSGKSRDEMRAKLKDDPMMKADWVQFDFLSCKAPEGTFK